jgi:hypothetical protein
MLGKRLRGTKGQQAAEAPQLNVAGTVRATISFPPDVYETLEGIAKEKKVSLAWVVREAVEEYIADKWPLFSGSKRG